MEDLVRRYLTLWKSFFMNSLTRDMEFKANFLGGLFVDTIFYGVHFFFFSVIDDSLISSFVMCSGTSIFVI